MASGQHAYNLRSLLCSDAARSEDMSIQANSPVDFQFERQGGADIQCEVQIWAKKAKYSPTDRPLHRVRFDNPLVAHEASSITLPPGAYVSVMLTMVREALNGVFNFRLTIEGTQAYTKKGDANTTAKPGDIMNFRADIDVVVV
jgi:hypothetical protein